MANVLVWYSSVLFLLLGTSQCCPIILEKGKSTQLECTVDNNAATHITWQVWNDQRYSDLTVCTFADNKCNNPTPSLYMGSVSSSSSVNKSTLNIRSIRTNETQFACVTDNGQPYNVCQIHVYAWPLNPTCGQTLTNTYVEYTCRAENVFPGIHVILRRREGNISKDDFDLNNTFCALGQPGSGSDGDYAAQCKFRIPMKNMYYKSTVYSEMFAYISDTINVTRPPAISEDRSTTLSIPQVVIYSRKCPVGPGIINGDYIKIGTSATCTCEIQSQGFIRGFARWYTSDYRIVGEENQNDLSSTLTMSYNYSDPTPTFFCYPVVELKGIIPGRSYQPKFTSCPIILEKGKSTQLECTVDNNAATHITWQVWNDQRYSDLTVCTFADNKCNNPTPSLYMGSVSSSSSVNKSTLNIRSIRTNETQFACVTDNGQPYNVCQIHVYAWPLNPTCGQTLTNTYVEYTCRAENVFPGIHVILRRREGNITKDDFDLNNTFCALGQPGSGSDGDYAAQCKFRIPMKNMYYKSTVYSEMFAYISDTINVTRPPAISEDRSTTLSIPQVVIYSRKCPVGPGIINGDYIKIGTSATCTCEIQSQGFIRGFARWYTSDYRIVGEENQNDLSSTLTMSYNYSDPTPTFFCYPVVELKGIIPGRSYQPKFISIPQVVIYSRKCPVGPGIINGDYIKIGTSATCTCEIQSQGFIRGFARWYTSDYRIVGEENQNDLSSTLTMSYNYSDPTPTFFCYPVVELKGQITGLSFKPKFTSSAPPSAIYGLQPLVVILGTFCAGLVSRVG